MRSKVGIMGCPPTPGYFLDECANTGLISARVKKECKKVKWKKENKGVIFCDAGIPGSRVRERRAKGGSEAVKILPVQFTTSDNIM